MTAALSGPLGWGLLWLVLAVALLTGPLALTVRGWLRVGLSPADVRRWYRPVTVGLVAGMLLAVGLITLLNAALTLGLCLLCLLFLLASIDWQWRWLPLEWSFAIIALGLIFAVQSGDPLRVLLQMAAPALLLLALRQTFLTFRGTEALGLGDIWLVAGLGAFLTLTQSAFLLGIAALSGLLEVGVRRIFFQQPPLKRGVSYGTHLCIIFVIIRNFGGLS
ncbi:MAG: prepilin peptidase [Pseudomonadota bacterium]